MEAQYNLVVPLHTTLVNYITFFHMRNTKLSIMYIMYYMNEIVT